MMATTGDINRTYHPSGDGRDIHYFISKGATIPSTSFLMDPWHTPKNMSSGSMDRSRTGPPGRYMADGSGRDAFKDVGGKPPATGPQFDRFRAPAPDGRTGLGYKGFHYPSGLKAGYTPNGTGRDIQMFADDPAISSAPLPRTGYQYSERPPHIKRYEKTVAASRTEGPLRTFANGSGRDMYLLAINNVRAAKIPRTATQFSAVAPSPKAVPAHGLKPVAMATSPPPKFKPSGSGRDTFNGGAVGGGWDHPTDRMGFGPASWDPAERARRPRSSGIAAAAQHHQKQAMSHLSRPRTTFQSPNNNQKSVSPGLMLPGSNLRR